MTTEIRHREKETSFPLPWERQINGTVESTGTYIGSATTQSMDDYVNPHYSYRAAQSGVLFPTNNCYTNKLDVFQQTTQYGWTYYPYFPRLVKPQVYSGSFPVASLFPDKPMLPADIVEMAQLRLETLTKCRASMTSNEMLIGVTLLEFGDTVAMLKNAVKAATRVATWTRNFLGKLRQSKTGTLRFSLQSASDLWMEFRFGWRPFLGEVETLSQCLGTLQQKQHRYNFREYGSLSFGSQSQSFVAVRNELSSAINLTVEQTVETKYSIRAGILAVGKPNGYPDRYGGSIFAIGKTAWDLVPFSWAVDYVFNVGDVIAASSPDSLWYSWDMYCSQTIEKTSKTEIIDSSFRYSGYIGDSGTGGYRKVTDIEYSRERITESPVNLIFKPSLSMAQIIDSTIAAKQVWGSVYKTALKTFATIRRKVS